VSAGARELELKAVVRDAAALQARLCAAGKLVFRGAMRDRRYDRPDRSMLARDEVLRVRTFEPNGAGEARAELTWKGPTRRTDGYKEREELQFSVTDAAAAEAVLMRLGFVVSDAIDRCVEYYEVQGAALRIEWYPRMDVLVEVEGAPADIERAVLATLMPRGEFNADRLLDFAGRYRQRTGRDAVLRLDMLDAGERPGFPKWAERT
jgi:predicted adenylyl cyclase CyaB